ncbi:MAG: arylsulfatase [Akkermansiaceae bacterium]|nr:arylsulfatase [Akkermansiaceae bacterium]
MTFHPIRRFTQVALAGLVCAMHGGHAPLLRAAEPTRAPNIIFIMADDLGYGDLGSYGQQTIKTPELDRLAAGGMRFTRHYAGSPVCAPSRCVLMTGRHPGNAFVRNNKEVGEWYSGEGQLPLPATTRTVAAALKAAGYATGAFGKWGLGGVGTSGDPLKQGFDRFFGFNDQRQAHNFYPQYLVDDDRRLPLPGNKQVVTRSGVKLPDGADPADPASYAAFRGEQYAPDLCRDRALDFIRAHRERPFFLYYPTTVPHLALQVPEDSLAEYQGKLDDKPYPGGNGYLPHPFPRAAYAAMITRMDRDIGRLVGLVRELGLAENTLIVFTSDNGAVYPLSGTDPAFFRSNGELRGFKGDVYEGGLRVPLIAYWPGRIPAGKVCERVTGFEDWFPTLLELAGATKHSPPALDGISFAPTLLGGEQPARPFLYREFPSYGGQQAVFADEWKLVRRNLLAGPKAQKQPTLELFRLADDPREQANLADAQPTVVERLLAIARREHAPSREFPFPALDNDLSCEQPSPADMAKAAGVELPRSPWHVANIWWDFEKEIPNFESLEVDVTIDRDVPETYNLYIAPVGVALINKLQFYGGLQTNVNGWANRTDRTRVHPGKGAPGACPRGGAGLPGGKRRLRRRVRQRAAAVRLDQGHLHLPRRQGRHGRTGWQIPHLVCLLGDRGGRHRA